MAIVIKGLVPKSTPVASPAPTPESAFIQAVQDSPTTLTPLDPTAAVFVPPPAPGPLEKALQLSAPPPPEPAPWEIQEDYTILNALSEFGTTAKRGKALWLVHRHAPGIKYLVKSWDASTNRAILEGIKKSVMKPVIGEREVPLYYPVWV